jgi:glutathione peroxidase
MARIHEFSLLRLDGQPLSMADYQGKVLLLVNTASACGFTPQYQGLERLHQEYGEQGLVVIGFPCNQFGGQEPGEASEIAAFCEKNYGVSFPLSAKIEVNGEGADPLFRYLTHEAPGLLGLEAVKWNFTKFLVDRSGTRIKRFAPTTVPEKLSGEIEALLAG